MNQLRVRTICLRLLLAAGLLLGACSAPPSEKGDLSATVSSEISAINVAQKIFYKDLGAIALDLHYEALEIEESSLAVWIISGTLPPGKKSIYPTFNAAGISINKRTGKILVKLYDLDEE